MHDWDGCFNDEPFWSTLHESGLPALRVKAGFGAGNVFESRCMALPPSQTTVKRGFRTSALVVSGGCVASGEKNRRTWIVRPWITPSRRSLTHPVCDPRRNGVRFGRPSIHR